MQLKNFSKVEAEFLDLKTRREIYDCVCKYPGNHLRGVQKLLNISVSLAEYHLNFLERHELLTTVEDGRYKRYYPTQSSEKTPSLGMDERHILGVLRQKIPLKIILFLLKKERNTSSHTDIQRYVKISPSTITFHLKKLVAYGVVKKIPYGSERGFILIDAKKIVRLLILYKPTPDIIDGFESIWKDLVFSVFQQSL